MKKNKMMRIASVLLVATLLSTCVISGTFAKYVTSGSSTDTARVAKFGVKVTGSSDLFNVKYEADDNSFTEAKFSVVSSSDDKLVAPGTKGSFTNFEITGKPEVAVRVTYEVTDIALENWTIDTEFYCPLFIKIGTVSLCGLDYASADDFATAIKDNVAAIKHDYKAKTNLAAMSADNLDISWEWIFEEGFEGLANTQTNIKDTYLGDRAAEGAAATVTLAVTCTVTQVD